MKLTWNQSLLFMFAGGVLVCVLLAWFITHENVRILLVGPKAIPQAGLIVFTAAVGVLGTFFPPVWWLLFEAFPFLSLVRQNGWKVGRLIYRRERCKHLWIYDPENSAKRTCSKCKSYQTQFQLPYPSSTKPSIGWRDQNFDELRFL